GPGDCRDHEREQRRPDPVARVPTEALAPGRAERADEPTAAGQPRAALEAVLLPLGVRGPAVWALPLGFGYSQRLLLPAVCGRLARMRDRGLFAGALVGSLRFFGR